MHASKRLRVSLLGLSAALTSTIAGCVACDVTNGIGRRPVEVKFLVNGIDPKASEDPCAQQGATRVAARARWTTSEGTVERSQSVADCKDGILTVQMGGTGTVQLTSYDAEPPALDDNQSDVKIMGQSSPVRVDLSSPVETPSVTADIAALRGTVNIHVSCGDEPGDCTGVIQESGADGLIVQILLDTNGADLEVSDQLSVGAGLAREADGHFEGTSHRGRIQANNVIRASARTPAGDLWRAEETIRMESLSVSVELNLRPAIVTLDAGFMPVDGGGTSSSSGVSSSSTVPSSSGTTSSSVGSSSSAEVSSSSAETSSSAEASSSSAEASSSSAEASSSSAEASSSSAAPSSSAEVSSSSAEVSSSSAAPSSSAEASSSSAEPSSSAEASSSIDTSSSSTM